MSHSRPTPGHSKLPSPSSTTCILNKLRQTQRIMRPGRGYWTLKAYMRICNRVATEREIAPPSPWPSVVDLCHALDDRPGGRRIGSYQGSHRRGPGNLLLIAA